MRNQGTEEEIKNRIDHMLAGPVWSARVVRTTVVDGIEVCAGHGHCHRALVSEVSRERHAAPHEPEWRPKGVTVCGETNGQPEPKCHMAYQGELADVYAADLRRKRGPVDDATGVPDHRERSAGHIAICSMDRRGLDDGCPTNCELPPTKAACVRVGGRGHLSNPFAIHARGGGGGSGQDLLDVTEAHQHLLAALASEGGGHGGNQPGVAGDIAGRLRDAGKSPGLRVRASQDNAQHELMRWRYLCGLCARVGAGVNVMLAMDEVSDMARTQQIRALLETGEGCGLGPQPAHAQDETRDWDALESGLGAGARIGVMQDAMRKAMAVAADQGKTGGAGGAGARKAANKVEWVTAVSKRLDSIQDKPTTADGWKVFLPLRRDLVNNVPPVYQRHDVDSDLLDAVRRLYSRAMEINMLNLLHGGEVTAEDEAAMADARLEGRPAQLQDLNWMARLAATRAEARKNRIAAREFMAGAGMSPETGTGDAPGTPDEGEPGAEPGRVTRQSSRDVEPADGQRPGDRLSPRELRLATWRWQGEVAAITTALAAVDEDEARRRRTDHYIQTLERAEA